jgi:hypothetical protein
MSPELQVLRRAREIISDPGRWTQGTFARDEDGNSCDPRDDFACRWCALGAVTKAAVILGADDGIGSGAVDLLYEAQPLATVVAINDIQGHEAILALFDRALEAA